MIFTCLSGRKVDFTNLDTVRASRVELSDISAGLSKVNRFGGQTEVPYSVAQHSMLVAALMIAEVRKNPLTTVHSQAEAYLVGLLHDAHEAFTSDIPTPAKNLIACTQVCDMEAALDEMVCKSLDVGDAIRFHYLVLRKKCDAEARNIEFAFLRDGITHPELTRVLPWGEAEKLYRTTLASTILLHKRSHPDAFTQAVAVLNSPTGGLLYGYPFEEWWDALLELRKLSGKRGPRECVETVTNKLVLAETYALSQDLQRKRDAAAVRAIGQDLLEAFE